MRYFRIRRYHTYRYREKRECLIHAYNAAGERSQVQESVYIEREIYVYIIIAICVFVVCPYTIYLYYGGGIVCPSYRYAIRRAVEMRSIVIASLLLGLTKIALNQTVSYIERYSHIHNYMIYPR